MPDPAQSFIPQARVALRKNLAVEAGGWLFSLSLVLVVVSVVAAGGVFFYRRSLESTLRAWIEQVSSQEAELRPELLAQVSELSSALAVARELLQNHVFSSNVLVFLQNIAHPTVQFHSLSFSRDARKIEVSGLAASYRSVAEQVSFMESHPQVEKVDFGGLSLGEKGLVNFKLAIIFRPSLIQLRSQ